jgi:hypothetical protein
VDWRIGNIGILRSNPCTLEDSYWLLSWEAFTIDPMPADQHKQIGILGGASLFNIRAGFITQNINFQKL